MLFFFKEKTAYEMRISDWSSDVCSSDLRMISPTNHGAAQRRTLHGVIVVERQPDAARIDPVFCSERQQLVHVGGDHAGGQECERWGRFIKTLEVIALVADQPPRAEVGRGPDDRFLLHHAERTHCNPDRVDRTST